MNESISLYPAITLPFWKMKRKTSKEMGIAFSANTVMSLFPRSPMKNAAAASISINGQATQAREMKYN